MSDKKIYGTVDFVVAIYNLGQATSSTPITLKPPLLSLNEHIILQAEDREVQTREITDQFDWINLFYLHGWDKEKQVAKTIQQMGLIPGINQIRVAINLESKGNCSGCGQNRITSKTFQADVSWQIRENFNI